MQNAGQQVSAAYMNALHAMQQRLQQQQQQQAVQPGNGTAPPVPDAHPPQRSATSAPAQQFPVLLTVPEQARPFTSRSLPAQQHTVLSENHLLQVLAQLQQDFGGEGYTGMPQYHLQPLNTAQPPPQRPPQQRPRRRAQQRVQA
jgi:hypothetical protein